MSEASVHTPYSSEYLSLLARKGKLSAKKIDNTWYTTLAVLDDYMKRQMMRAQIQSGNFNAVASQIEPQITASGGTPQNAVAPEVSEKVGVTQSVVLPVNSIRSYHEDIKEYLNEFEKLQAEKEAKKVTVEPEIIRQTALDTFFGRLKRRWKEMFPASEKEESVYQPTVFEQRKSSDQTKIIRPSILDSLSEGIKTQMLAFVGFIKNIFSIKKEKPGQTESIPETLTTASTISSTNSAVDTTVIEKALEKVLDKKLSGGTNFRSERNYFKSFRTVFSSRFLGGIAVLGILAFTLFPVPVVFGLFEKSFDYVKSGLKDANTVLGFRPGTHANEILLLNKEGNISILGHIETEGQLRSYIQDGTAPIVVDSKTLVKNLNAEYFGGASSTDFTLAFVTKNGSVTTEDVQLQGNVEVGKTLLVKGATKLLASLNVGGDLSVFGEAEFNQTLRVLGPAYFESIVNMKSDLLTQGNLTVRKNINVRGGLEVGSGIIAKGGSFTDLSASGDLSGKNIYGTDILVKNATTTNFFAENFNATLSVINSIISNDISVGALTATDATTTNLNSTNLVSTNSTSTNATTTNFFANNATFGNITFSGSVVGDSTTTNATSTNFFSTNIFGNNANLQNLLVNSSTTLQDFTFRYATGSAATTTNFYAHTANFDNLTLSNGSLALTNSTTTNATTTNLAILGNLYTSLTQGSVPFIGANGLLSQNNSELFWNSSTNNLGIGTNNPQRKLHIFASSTGTFTNIAFENPDTTNNNGSVVSFRTNTTGVGASNFFEYAGFVGKTIEHDASTFKSAFQIFSRGASGFNMATLDYNGNFGIGTTSPYRPLSVTGKAIIEDSVLSSYFTATSTTATSTFMGAVGIGTTTPGAKLDVNGDALIHTVTVGLGGGTNNTWNTAIGYHALINDSGSGAPSIAIGNNALGTAVTSGNRGNNIAIGTNSMGNIGNGDNYGNVGIGYYTLLYGGLYNTAIGNSALSSNSGNYNVALGYSTMQNNRGDHNVALGLNALGSLGFSPNPSYNVGVGNYSLYNNVHGSSNVGLGFTSGMYETGSNSFYVNNIDQTSTANDKAYSLLYGNFAGVAGSLVGQQLTVNGGLNINGNSTSTNATSTNSFFTQNLFSTNSNLGTTNFTNGTSTSLYGVNVFGANGNFTTLQFGNGTSTNATSTNSFYTQNLFANVSNLGAATTTSIYGVNVFGANGNFGPLIYTNGTSTNATSTNSLFATNLFSTISNTTNLTAVAATTTDFYASHNASTTNLFANTEVIGSSTIGKLFVNFSTTTNGTSTNFFSTNLFSTNSNLGTTNFTNGTSTSLYGVNVFGANGNFTTLQFSNGTSTNATSTNNFYSPNLFSTISNTQNLTYINATGTSATTTNLFSTNSFSTIGNIQSLVYVNATGTSATTTNFYATNLFGGNFNFTNLIFNKATGTSATTTNLFSANIFGSLANITQATSSNVFSTNLFSNNSNLGTTSLSNLTVTNNNTSSFAGAVTVAKSLSVGTGINDTLTVTARINSNLVPDANITRDIGSASLYWKTAYIDTLNVNTISGSAVAISGTTNNDWTINTDNATSDTENMNLIFFRGLVTPNAVIAWDSLLDKFNFNQPTLIQNQSSTTTVPTLDVRAQSGQLADVFRVTNTSNIPLFNVNMNGNVGIATSTPANRLSIVTADTATIGGVRVAHSGDNSRFVDLNYDPVTSQALINFTTGGVASRRFDIQYSGTPVASFLGTGNVGIASTTPFATFAVNPTAGNASNQFVIGSSTATNFLINNSGFIGIGGTITPTNRIDILVNPVSNYHLTLGDTSNTGAGTGYPVISGGSTALFLNGASVQSQSNFYPDSDLARSLGVTGRRWTGLYTRTIIDNGVVGIGTTTPLALLDVAGALGSQIDIFNVSTTTSTNIVSSLLKVDASGLTTIANLLGSGSTTLQNFTFVNATGTNSTTTNTYVSGKLSTSFTAGSVVFATSSGILAQNNSQFFWDNGNNRLGIGTAVPDNILNLRKDQNGNTAINLYNATSNTGAYTELLIGQSGTNGNYGGIDHYSAAFTTSGANQAGSTQLFAGYAGDLVLTAGGNGTARAIQFWNYNGSNTAERMRIGTNGNVGIGTTTPQSLLHVYGDAKDIAIDFPTASSYGFFNFKQAGVAKADITLIGSGFVTTGRRGDLELSANTGDLTLQPINGGNVGIGTSSPSTMLSVAGTGFPLATFKRNDAGASVGIDLIEGNGNYNRLVTNGATGDFGIRPNGTEKFTILSASGNVGIGTTSPSTLLEIYKSGGSQIRLNGVSNTDINEISFRVSAGRTARILSGYTNPAVNTETYLAFNTNVSGSSNDTVAEAMRIVGGNVGIGTTSPYASLSVAGRGIFDQDVQADYFTSTSTTISNTFPWLAFTNATGTSATTTNFFSTNLFGTNFNITNLAYTNATGTNATTTNQYISGKLSTTFTLGSVVFASTSGILAQNNNKFFWDNTNARLGIGTPSPAYPLDVNGNGSTPLLSLHRTTVGVGAITFSLSNVMGGSVGGDLAIDGTVASQGFIFRPRNSSNASVTGLGIDRNGNVGVGTTSPNYIGTTGRALTVSTQTVGDPTAVELVGQTGTQDFAFSRIDAVNGLGTQQVPSSRISFQRGSSGNDSGTIAFSTVTTNGGSITERMRIDNNGNVGIGTTTPASLNGFSQVLSLGGTAPSITLNSTNGGTVWEMGNDGSGRWRLLRGTSSVLTADTSGNVGIGTTSPASKLQVAKDVAIGAVAGGISGANLTQFSVTGSTDGAQRISFGYDTTNNYGIIAASDSSAWRDLYLQPNVSSGIPNVTIKAAGNVGLGTTNPSTLLHVGSTSPSDIASTNYYRSGFIAGDLEVDGTIYGTNYLALGSTTLQNFTFVNATGTNATSSTLYVSGNSMLAATGGRVGVGTNAPASLFSVSNNLQVDSTGRIGIGAAPATYALYTAGVNNSAFTQGIDLTNFRVNPANGGVAAFNTVNSYVNPPSGGTAVSAAGLDIIDLAVTNVAGTLTNLYGIKVNALSAKGASATVTNQYSALFALPTNGSNNKIGVLIGTAPAGPITSSLYVSSGISYFGGNVGIGTTTPATKLDVAGASPTINVLDVGTSYAITRYRASNNTTNEAYFGVEGSGAASLITGGGSLPSAALISRQGAYPIQFATNNVARMTIDSNGRVGIATTTPGTDTVGSFLSLTGNISQYNTASPQYVTLLATNFSSSRGIYTLESHAYDGSGVEKILTQIGAGQDTASTGYLRFGTQDGSSLAERMRITSTGNVGIGTSSPYASLSVAGRGIFDQDVRADYFTSTSTTISNTFPWLAFTNATGTNSTTTNFAITRLTLGSVPFVGTGGAIIQDNANFFFDDTNNRLGIATNAPNATLAVNGATNINGILSLFGAGLLASNKATITHNDQNLTVTTTGGTGHIILSPTGNVGINSTLPTAKLTVVGSTYSEPPGGIASSTVAVFANNGAANGTSSISILSRSSAISSINFGTELGERSGYIDYYRSAKSPYIATTMDFGTGNISRMVIDGNGNVGIGTTTPTAKLEVYNGASRFWHNGTAEYTDLTSNNEINHYTSGGVGSTLYIQYSSNANTNIGKSALLVQGNNGNVGVGTTSPSSKLDVFGQIRSSNTTGNNAIYSAYIGGVNEWTFGQRGSNSAFVFNNGGNFAGTDVVTILTNGSVGVGTTSPAAKLDVLAASNANGFKLTNSSLSGGSSGQPGYIFYNVTNTATPTNSDLRISEQQPNSGTIRMVLSGGNVGIASTTPYARLSVAGVGATTGVTFQTTNNSDVPNFTILDSGNIWFGNTVVNPSSGFGDTQRGMGYNNSNGHFEVSANNAAPGEFNRFGGTGDLLTFRYAGTTAGGISSDANSLELYATSTLIFGSNGTTERMRITPTGRVGIGTTSPQSKLEVSSSGASESSIRITSDSGQYRRLLFIDGAASPTKNNYEIAEQEVDNGLFIGPSASVGGTTFDTAKGLTVISSGNVGVGQPAPVSKLHVGATATARTQTNAVLIADNNSDTLGIAGSSAPSINFYTNALTQRLSNIQSVVQGTNGGQLLFQTKTDGGADVSERMRIDGNGLVGINTQTAVRVLQVNATTTASVAFNAANLNSWATMAVRAQVGVRNGATGIVFHTDTNSTASPNSGAGIAAIDTQSGSWGGVAELAFMTAASNISTERLRITSAGSVGIGTSTPSGTLHILGANGAVPTATTGYTPQLRLESSATAGVGVGPVMMFGGQTNNATTPYNFAAIQGVKSSATAGNYSGDLLFYTQNSGGAAALTEQMRITAAGNVGIGTTTPGTLFGGHAETLSIFGRGLTTNDGNVQMYLGGFDSGTYGKFGTLNNVPLRIGTNANDRMTIDTSGNVGIGTTTPSSVLSIYGLSAAAPSSNNGSIGDSSIFKIHSNAGTTLSVGMLNASPYTTWIQQKDSNANGVYYPIALNPLGGNVGIGTTSPVGILAVANSSNTSVGQYLSLEGNSTSNNGLFIYDKTGRSGPVAGTLNASSRTATAYIHITADGDGLIINKTNAGSTQGVPLTIINKSSADSFQINNDSSVLFNVTSGGNVGIGAAVPSSKLQLVGTTSYSDPSLTHGTAAMFSMQSGSGTDLVFGSMQNSPFTAWIQHRHATNDGSTYALSLQPLGGNVGIGTTGPHSPLEVVGRVIGSNLVVSPYGSLNDTTGVANTLQFGNYTASAFVTSSADSYIYKTSNVFSGLAAQTLIFQTRSDSTGGGFAFVGGSTPAPLMYIQGSGNVGIGSTTPFATFAVNPTAGLASNQFVVGSSTATNFIITNSGNVGIVTVAPVAKLDVVGVNGVTSQFNSIISARGGNIANNSNSFEWGHANASGYGSTLGYYYSAGTPYLAFNGSAGTNINTFKTNGIQASIILSNVAGGMQFGNVASASADNQTFVPLVTMLASGNLGIGTTTPASQLVLDSVASTGLQIATGGIQDLVITGSTANNKIDSRRSNPLYFQINSATKMTIDGSGNVGISTTTPSALLTIAKASAGINVGDSSSALTLISTDSQGIDIGSQLHFSGNTNGTDAANPFATIAGRKENGTNGNYSGYLQFSTSNSSGTVGEGMRITSTGRVGISTTTPFAMLDVYQTTGIPAAFFSDSAGGSGGSLRLISASLVGQDFFLQLFSNDRTTSGKVMHFTGANGGNDTLDIDLSLARVGIGTSSPLSKLSIQSSGATSATTGLNVANSNGTSALLVRDDGNVGIGSTTPNTKLVVVGTTTARDIIPDANLTYNLGTSAQRWNQSWVGTQNIGTSTWSLSADNSGSLAFNNQANAAGTQTVTFAQNGNVGIGVTQPLFDLDVAGNSRFYGVSTTPSSLNVFALSPSWSSGVSANGGAIPIAISSTTVLSYTIGSIYMGKTDGTNVLFYPAFSMATVDANFYGGTYANFAVDVLDSTRIIVVYNYSSWGVKAVVCNYNATTVTSCGTPVTMGTFAQPVTVDVKSVGGGSFLATYTDYTAGGIDVRLSTTSGTTISLGTQNAVRSVPSYSATNPGIMLFSATTTRAAIHFYSAAPWESVVIVNFSGGVLTCGTPYATNAANSSYIGSAQPLSDTSFINFVHNSNVSLDAMLVTVTGTSTVATSTVASLSTVYSATVSSAFLDGSNIAVGYGSNFRILGVSSTTLVSIGGEQSAGSTILGLTPLTNTSFLAGFTSTDQIFKVRTADTTYANQTFDPSTASIIFPGMQYGNQTVWSNMSAKLDSTRHILFTAQNGSGYQVRVGQKSGSSLSYGPSGVYVAATSTVSWSPSAIAVLDANTVALINTKSIASVYWVDVAVCTISVITPSCGSSISFAGGYSAVPVVGIAAASAGQFVVSYGLPSGSATSVTARTVQYTGTTINSFGNPVTVASNINVADMAMTAINGTTTQFALVYNETSGNPTQAQGKVIIGGVNGSSISLGSLENYATATSTKLAIASPLPGTLFIASDYSSNNNALISYVGVSSTNLSVTSTTTSSIGGYSTNPWRLSALDSTHLLFNSGTKNRVINVSSSGVVGISSEQTVYANSSTITDFNSLSDFLAIDSSSFLVRYHTDGAGPGPYSENLILQTMDPNAFYYQKQALVINSTGTSVDGSPQVGIGTNNPLYTLHVSSVNGSVAGFSVIGGGTCTINPTNTALTCTSDARLKTNISTIASSTEILRRLRGVNFSWKNDETMANHIGFIAQDVQSVVPELVTTGADGFLQVNYLDFAPILANAWNDLDLRVTDLENLLNKGNVGIGMGTTTPLNKLVVAGGVSIGSDFNLLAPENGLIVEGQVAFGTSTPNADSALTVDGAITFFGLPETKAGDKFLCISDNGEVSVGDVCGQASTTPSISNSDMLAWFNDASTTMASTTDRVIALETRLSTLEQMFASSTGFVATASTSPSIIADTLTAMGASIVDGVTHFKQLAVESLSTYALSVGTKEKPTGITVYDQVNGAPYCMKVVNGQAVTTAGDCQTYPGAAVYNVPVDTTPTTPTPPVDTSTTTPSTDTSSSTPGTVDTSASTTTSTDSGQANPTI